VRSSSSLSWCLEAEEVKEFRRRRREEEEKRKEEENAHLVLHPVLQIFSGLRVTWQGSCTWKETRKIFFLIATCTKEGRDSRFFEKVARKANVHCRFLFVACQHPHSNSRAHQICNSGRDPFLKFVFDSCCPEQKEVGLNLFVNVLKLMHRKIAVSE